MARVKVRATPDPPACLVDAWAGIFELPLPWGNIPPDIPMFNWVETQDIHACSISSQDMRCVGFSRPGILALRRLIRGIRKSENRYMRLVGLSVLTDHLADVLRTRWKLGAGCPDVDWVRNELDTWLSSHAGTQTHFIPCKISSQPADAFEIGPTKFVHIDSFAPAAFGLKYLANGQPVDLERWKTEYRADWIAIVDVRGRETKRSLEVAELTVDLCLGALQTMARDPLGRDISRLTGRTMFDQKLSLVSDAEGHWSHGWSARQSFDMPGPILTEFLQQAAGDLRSMGRIISRFKDEDSLLPLVEQGWCDALFWFHQALSEPLDSVAITKMETAIENLFCAESSKRSRARLLQGFRSLFGVDGSSQFDAILPVTVEEFVEVIVTARSRILHGTWSTLAGRDVEVERRDVARLTQNFLMTSARAIDAYAQSREPPDNIDDFLAWAERCRHQR